MKAARAVKRKSYKTLYLAAAIIKRLAPLRASRDMQRPRHVLKPLPFECLRAAIIVESRFAIDDASGLDQIAVRGVPVICQGE